MFGDKKKAGTKIESRKPKQNNKRQKKLKRSSGLFIAPSFLGVLLFFFLPFVVVIYYSMVNNPISGTFVFLDNFFRLVKNLSFQTAIRNTIMFSVIAVPLAVVPPALMPLTSTLLTVKPRISVSLML